ncbi:MAG TPA: 5-formyltetrahydrofolate cyclo-ligase [Solimonas sp.]|nr:5-formyltetrahydrofolate cyclo-ligase [Solimonas sp.]
MRRTLRLRRASVSGAARTRAARTAAAHALRLVQGLGARDIALYLPCGSELDTRPLLEALWARGCRTWVPQVIDPTRMRFRELRRETSLRRGHRGLTEPAGHTPQTRYNRLDLVFLPLVGFDRRGYRLGAGGGHYDRWLARPRPFRRPLLAGYAYALQEVPQLPHDPWDRRLDLAVTEQGIQRWPIG